MNARDSASPPPPRHLVSVRFAATLGSNVLGLGASFLAALAVAKGLGPARYGDLCFLIACFAAVAPLLDMGSSSAFYTFLSRRRRAPFFFQAYGLWLAAQMLVVLAAIAAAPAPWLDRLWLGQGRTLVFAAAGAGFLANQFWKCVSQIGESARETIRVQASGMLINVIHAALMAALLFWSRMTVALVLAAIAAEYAVVGAGFLALFPWNSVVDPAEPRPSANDLISEYARYCRPLVLAGWAGFLYIFTDRWLLQRFAGSVQQGYFSLGSQFSAIGLIGAASFVNILWKEVAQAHAAGDAERSGLLFARSSRALYFLAAAAACFAIPFSRDFLSRVLGPAYAGSWPTFAVLALFPLHQTLGQINATYFQAMAKTRLYMIFTVLTVAAALPLGYLVLAPASALVPGLGLGSLGLAVKMVVLQAVLVNLQGAAIARGEGWRWPLAHQFLSPCLLLALSALAYGAMSFIPADGPRVLIFIKIGAGGLLYAGAVAFLVVRFPALIGADPESLRRWRENARQYLWPQTQTLKP